jgi:hypothetical protein
LNTIKKTTAKTAPTAGARGFYFSLTGQSATFANIVILNPSHFGFMSQADNVQILADYVDSFDDNGRGFMKEMYEEARRAMDVGQIGDAKVRIMFGAIVRQVWMSF